MTVRHCPGCRGYASGMAGGCTGIPVASGLAGADLIVPDVVPPLGLLDRIRVLFGQPVLMGVRAGPVGEPFEVMDDDDPGLPAWIDDVERFRDAG